MSLDIVEKVQRVFLSCKTKGQLECAVRFSELAAKSVGGFSHKDFLKIYSAYYFSLGALGERTSYDIR